MKFTKFTKKLFAWLVITIMMGGMMSVESVFGAVGDANTPTSWTLTDDQSANGGPKVQIYVETISTNPTQVRLTVYVDGTPYTPQIYTASSNGEINVNIPIPISGATNYTIHVKVLGNGTFDNNVLPSITTYPTSSSITINYYDGNTTPFKTVSVYDFYKENYKTISYYDKPGYTFLGWSKTDGGSVDYEPDQLIGTISGSVLNLYAVWKPILYSLTYDFNNGTNYTLFSTQKEGNSITVNSTIPTQNGYTFDYWIYQGGLSSDPNNGLHFNKDNTFLMPASDVTLLAHWTPIPKYTLTYDFNNDTSTTLVSTHIEGDSITVAPTIPTQDGYIFDYWIYQG